MRKIRLGAKGGALLAVLGLSLLFGEKLGENLPAPLLAALPALLFLLSDALGERPAPRRLPLLLALSALLLYAAAALFGGGWRHYLPYGVLASLLALKAGVFPHGRGKRRASFFFAALLALSAGLTARPPIADPEAAGSFVGWMEMGLLPLLLSLGLAAACRPLLAGRRGALAALGLAAFMLMTLAMGALWYAWLVNYHVGALQEGFMRHTVLLYREQPLLYFALLELFAPLSYGYLKSARYIRNNRSRREKTRA